MYGKHFQSTYTGSMLGAGADVFAVWGYVIAHTVNSAVELNPNLLAFILGMELKNVEIAIEYLCQPDAKSRNKVQEGRRLVRTGEYLYEVTTHSIYRKIQNPDEKREADRNRQRKHREEGRESQLSHDVTNVTNVAHTEAYTDTNTYTEAENLFPVPENGNGNGRTKKSSKTTDPKHTPFKELVFRCYQKLNDGQSPPWDGSDAKQLDLLLKAAPTLTEENMKALLTNYFYSKDHAPGDRPRKFLPNLMSYSTVLNKFRREDVEP